MQAIAVRRARISSEILFYYFVLRPNLYKRGFQGAYGCRHTGPTSPPRPGYLYNGAKSIDTFVLFLGLLLV